MIRNSKSNLKLIWILKTIKVKFDILEEKLAYKIQIQEKKRI
jgi:hypothetical protein